jgi:hypothetical protein
MLARKKIEGRSGHQISLKKFREPDILVHFL